MHLMTSPFSGCLETCWLFSWVGPTLDSQSKPWQSRFLHGKHSQERRWTRKAVLWWNGGSSHGVKWRRCSRLWHYRKTSPATVRKFLASLRLCNLLVNHHGDIGCWEVLGRETECIQRRQWQRSQSIKSLKVDSSSGAKEQRKIGSSCLVVTNAQFSKSPIVSGVWPRLPTTDVVGPESKILAPRRENHTHWLVWDGSQLLFALKGREVFNQLHVFFLTAQNLHNILQNLEATTDSFSLSQDSLRTWQILTQNFNPKCTNSRR